MRVISLCQFFSHNKSPSYTINLLCAPMRIKIFLVGRTLNANCHLLRMPMRIKIFLVGHTLNANCHLIRMPMRIKKPFYCNHIYSKGRINAVPPLFDAPHTFGLHHLSRLPPESRPVTRTKREVLL